MVNQTYIARCEPENAAFLISNLVSRTGELQLSYPLLLSYSKGKIPHNG
jgi:hypothetical protein